MIRTNLKWDKTKFSIFSTNLNTRERCKNWANTLSNTNLESYIITLLYTNGVMNQFLKDFYSTNDVERYYYKVKELNFNKKMTFSDCQWEVCLGKYLISEGYGNFIFSADNREFHFILLQIRPCHLSLLMNYYDCWDHQKFEQ